MNLKKLLLSFTALILSCSSNYSSNTSSQNSYIASNDYEDLKITEETFFSMEEEYYGVYLYSSYCVTCERMKEYLYNYLDNVSEKSLTMLYLFNISENEETFQKFKIDSNISYEDANENMKGTSSINELYFFYTPSIYFIKQHQIDNVFFDSNDIFNYLTAI